MHRRQFNELFVRLYTDRTFRARFVQSPAAVLREEGFDPDMLQLPSRIDPQQLDQRLKQVFENQDPLLARPADVAKLTADQLWERFAVIGLKPGLLADGSDTATVAAAVGTAVAAVVAYGTSMVTSSAASQLTVLGGGARGLRSLDQLKQLRDLARLPADQLRFSVSGPDGVAIEGLSTELIKAFIDRQG